MSQSPNLSRYECAPIELGEGVSLRTLRPDDVAQSYVDGLNNPGVNRFLVSRGQHTLHSAREWVETNWVAGDAIVFGLFDDARHIGNLRLHDIAADQAYLGIAIFDPGYHGKGLGTRAIRAVSRFAFETLGLETVMAGVDLENTASRRAFERAGYTAHPPTQDRTCVMFALSSRRPSSAGEDQPKNKE